MSKKIFVDFKIFTDLGLINEKQPKFYFGDVILIKDICNI